MSTAALKRELALLRSSLAALTPAQSAALDDPIAWAERISELTLDPWQCDVLLSAAPRLLLNATRQSRTRRRCGLPVKGYQPLLTFLLLRKLLVLNRARFATSIQHGAQKSDAFGICVQSIGV